MLIKKILYLVLVIILITGAAYSIDEHELFSRKVNVNNGSTLSIADCVALAFRNSPKIKRYKYELDIAKSQLGIARSVYFPIFSAGADFYNENNSNNVYYDRTYRNLPSVRVTLNKLIWDFGKSTAMINIEKFRVIAAEYEFIDSICATLFDTKIKYYRVLRAQSMFDITKQNLAFYKYLSKIAVNNLDKETSQVNINLAKVRYTNAENDLMNAKVDLNNVMYLNEPVDFKVIKTRTFNIESDLVNDFPKTNEFSPENFGFSRDKALDIAYANSPDLKVLVNTKLAMEQNLLYIKRTYFPQLSANVGYGFNNNNISSTNNSLQVGVNLSSSVNLAELRHSIKGADAQTALAENEITLFKKNLMFEVNRAYNNIDAAQKKVYAAYDAIGESADVLKAVESAYKKGKDDIIALLWSYEDYMDALYKYVESIYEYNLALIQLEMATHSHIADIHHKSEHAIHYHSDDLIKHLTEALNCDEQDEKTHKKNKLNIKQEKL